ncbi:putative translation elongation factor eEF-1, gamma chain [Cryphonectria parasitica EP155]|uniref:Translation elongation factor eEF-1, gamma chain n=1 Tax=Cryphonectria parasitica (strain ATCC 38755 / EP155) TaxID=660469 RepID=A0A9P4XT42_CRYP1|nr:putative translation elongation factor eEF-1, gamma chain [Cryphonectria parasitica EP155]KAF3760200.1 putative translation elongation factor eEF-1, gamma chain [Cryphonectria parasitica EP155]
MAFGKLYTYEQNPRSTAIRAVAKANDLDLEIVEVNTEKPTPEYLKLNKLGKVPTFEGQDGYTLYECMAIAIYSTSQNEKTTLLGKTKQDYASILKWMSYFNTEVLPALGKWYRPLLGRDPYNKKNVDDASKSAAKALATVEEHLQHNTFLVGERITLADLFATGIIARGFEFFFDKQWRQEHPNVSRWYSTVYNQAIYSAVAPKFELLDTPKLTNVAPKKPEQPKKETPKAAPKPAAEEEPAEAPKPKHPLEALPRSSFALDEWKRYYSNHDEADSLKWFWENVPFTDYSIWKCSYKYNDELTLTFMSNNLIGGFNNRLEGSRKYLFGCASVYGENNASVIEGAFVIRGDDFKPVFDVAPDYESYEFEKLDPTNPEHKAYVEAQWTWDKPVVVDGKEYKHASGKVFK